VPKRRYTEAEVSKRWRRIWLFSAPRRLLGVVHESHWPALLLTVVPLLGLFGFVLVGAKTLPTLHAVTGIALGVLYWSFIEYAVHRFVYHALRALPFRNFLDCLHSYHHRYLDDPRVLNAGPLLAYPITAACLLPAWLLFGSTWAALLGIGLVSAYGFYEYTHSTIHRTAHDRGYFAWAQRYHFFHHRRDGSANFGNTSPLWDLIFGTYRAEHSTFELSQAELESL
jgi:sterol desaturase/sphingolipid hydroxylase (fatty acid hydroxylase superfamily)